MQLLQEQGIDRSVTTAWRAPAAIIACADLTSPPLSSPCFFLPAAARIAHTSTPSPPLLPLRSAAGGDESPRPTRRR